MKKLRILKQILKRTGADKILSGFIAFFFLAALIIWIWEPNIPRYQDALWYCYSVFSTVGFGDEIAVTILGRVISVLITILSIFVIAIITGVVVAFYNDLVSIRYKASKAEILDKLERLPELSKEELKEISDKIKVLKE